MNIDRDTYNHCRKIAVSQAKSMLSSEDSEDVAQEVMMKLLLKAPELSDRTNIEGWVRVVAKNASIDLLRSQGAYDDAINGVDNPGPEDNEEDAAEQHAVYSVQALDLDSPEELYSTEQMIDLISSDYEELPEQYKETLDLVIEGLSHAEIAEKLGQPVENIRQRLVRIKRYIMESIND